MVAKTKFYKYVEGILCDTSTAKKLAYKYNGKQFGHPEYFLGEVYQKPSGEFFWYQQEGKMKSIMLLQWEEAKFILRLLMSQPAFEELFSTMSPSMHRPPRPNHKVVFKGQKKIEEELAEGK